MRQLCSYARMSQAEVDEEIKNDLKRDDEKYSQFDSVKRQPPAIEFSKLKKAQRPAFAAEDCAICLDDLKKPIQSECDHLFCFECIVAYFEAFEWRKCP